MAVVVVAMELGSLELPAQAENASNIKLICVIFHVRMKRIFMCADEKKFVA